MLRLIAIFTLIFAGLMLLGPTGARAEHDIGKVSKKAYRGAYGLRVSGAKKTLYYREKVYQNEVVKTGKNGETTLRLLDRTKLQIGPASTLTLDDMVYDSDKTVGEVSLEFTTGMFRFISGKMANNDGFKLRTPIVDIGIRGTDFVVMVAADGGTRIAVRSGALEISPRGGGAVGVVQANQTATIAAADADVTIAPGYGVPSHPSMGNNNY